MENKQIALIVLLILIGIFILILSLKLYNFLKEIEKKKSDQTTYSKFSLNVLEQTIKLSKCYPYRFMKLTKDYISYYNINNDEQEYQFQTDQNNNWRCCYLQKDNNNKDKYPKNKYGQSEELLYFSNNQMDQNKTYYYYNQQITQQELKNGSINVLNAYIMHLNDENWDKFLKTDFKEIPILFLPSNILDQTHMENTSKEEIKKNVQKKYQEFLFQFEPIQYKIELLYQKVFFTYQKDNKLYFIDFDFKKSFITLHRIRTKPMINQFEEILDILTSFLLKDSEDKSKGLSICTTCNMQNENKNEVSDYYMGCKIAYKYSQLEHQGYEQNAEDSAQQLKSYIQNLILKV